MMRSLIGNQVDVRRLIFSRNVFLGFGILLVLGFGYFRDLGRNPFGIFCDEALIGLKAKDFSVGRKDLGISSLFYDHFGTVAGNLPVLAAAPFVTIFGLTEWSLRLTSVVLTFGIAAVLFLTIRLTRLPYPWLAPLFFLLSPLTIHLGRINFGHAPSLFVIALGFYFYTRSRLGGRSWIALIGGLLLASSAYGYPGFYAAAPLFFLLILLVEIPWAKRTKSGRLPLLALIIGFGIGFAPIVYKAFNDDKFMERFRQKSGEESSSLISMDRVWSVFQNYPKYFRFDYLYETGETGQRGSLILRHSVLDAGLLPWVTIPFILAGIVTLFRSFGNQRYRAYYPFLLLAFTFPLPDLLTTTPLQAPYTFSAATGMLCFPFVCAVGVDAIYKQLQEGKGLLAQVPVYLRNLMPTVAVGWLLLTSAIFVFSTYPNYAWHASGYWGWQSGPRDIIAYYLDHQDTYSSLKIENWFNQPDALADFYIDDPTIRQTVTFGSPDPNETHTPDQLIAITPATYDYDAQFDEGWEIVHTVSYPDDSPAFHLIHRSNAPPVSIIAND